VERILDWVGSAAHGVVTREHLLQEGVTVKEIRSRLEIGTLIREHRGVYRGCHQAPSVEAR
jgi:Transcriptional regulator, AbiEi antitoxin